MTKINEAAGVSDFDKLIEEITDVAKALPADDAAGDENIADAAADGEDDESDAEGEGDGNGDGKPVAKSFEVTLADGSKGEAFDATDLIKSLGERNEKLEGAVGAMFNIVKSLRNEVTALKAAPRGRKSVVTVHEKPNQGGNGNGSEVAKSTMSNADFMAKAMESFTGGKISGFTLTKLENQLANGKQPDPAVVKVVLGL